MTLELGVKPPGYTRRHARPNDVVVGVKQAFVHLVRELDLPLAVASALAVFGTVFAVFSLVACTFHFDRSLAFIFGGLGTVGFVGAVAVWYFFAADQQPKHGKGR